MIHCKNTTIILLGAVFALVMAGCHHETATMRDLASIDSLLTSARQYESALQRLDSLNTDNFSKPEQAYYSLLITQAHYKNYIDDTTDAVINVAVDYYKNHSDREKRTRSLLYQGCVYEVNGEPEKAIESYKQIEEVADEEDLENRAYAKLRLVELYGSKLYYTKPKIKLAKEALNLYRQLGDKHYQIVCLTTLGSLFREDMVMRDSALLYLGEAIRLAHDEHETWFEFQNLYHRAEMYCLMTKEYEKAKVDILKAIAAGKNEIDHPRAHYIAAETYLHLGQRDSAVYYFNHAPASMDASNLNSDKVMYYHILSEIAKYDKDWDGYTKNTERAHSITDSILSSSVRQNYQAVEKKYDIQLAELNKVKYQSRFRGTLLLAALLALGLLALAFLVWRYRNQLKMRQSEVEMLKADLDGSLASLEHMQARLDVREQSLPTDEDKKAQSDELRAIINQQIDAVHQLMTWSYQYDGDKFAAKFREMMTLPSVGDDSNYWSNLQALVNDLHDNVLVKAQDAAGGTLNDSELNLLALYCCGFSRTVIMVTMGYKSIGTVYNKKLQIAKKLHVADLDDFVKPHLNKE